MWLIALIVPHIAYFVAPQNQCSSSLPSDTFEPSTRIHAGACAWLRVRCCLQAMPVQVRATVLICSGSSTLLLVSSRA
eukprot:m.1252560 g.1252560  ORF g.1252560 m.1252560 type:complete len:78 (-) comp24703_c0_seq67:3918-4151(-)